MTVSAGDAIVLELHGFADTYLGSSLTINISSLVSSPVQATTTASVSGIKIIAPDFDVPKAIAFLVAAQKPDGSMSSWLLSDWTAFAFASYGSGGMEKLREHFRHSSPNMANVTDYERHAMALLALGMNPYSETGVDYISPIVDAFDGTQVGDTALMNDDIFAIFPLLHAGYSNTDSVIEAIKSGIIRAQRTDGSWEGSVDLTAATVQAPALFPRTGEVEVAINRADGFLASKQQDDGGFGNSFSTAWTLQAIQAIGDSHTVWTKSIHHTPRYYLSKLQQTDGGVETMDTGLNTRLWATAYAIPGVLGKTWDSILASFPKPQPIATTTPEIGTTTSESATIVSVETTEPSVPEEVEEVPEPEETSDTASTTLNQVAAVGSIDTNAVAAGMAALFSLLLLLAILYSLLRGKKYKTTGQKPNASVSA